MGFAFNRIRECQTPEKWGRCWRPRIETLDLRISARRGSWNGGRRRRPIASTLKAGVQAPLSRGTGRAGLAALARSVTDGRRVTVCGITMRHMVVLVVAVAMLGIATSKPGGAQTNVETQRGVPPTPSAASPEYAPSPVAPTGRPALTPPPGEPALAPAPGTIGDRGQPAASPGRRILGLRPMTAVVVGFGVLGLSSSS